MFLPYSILITSFLTLATCEGTRQQSQIPLINSNDPSQSSNQNNDHLFSLRHIFHHGTHTHPKLHKQITLPSTLSTLWLSSDLSDLSPLVEITRPLTAHSSPVLIHRLSDRRPSVIEPLISAAQNGVDVWESSEVRWEENIVDGPDVKDKETVLTLAYMGANAYEPAPNEGEWMDVGSGFNESLGFGWEKEGVRGYVYTNEAESTVVISFKGGSARFWNPLDTAWADKENVNLLFGCCCGQGTLFSHRVCHCASGINTCDVSCVGNCLRKEEKYYFAARQIYSNITAIYPDAKVWLTGHSLGGTMSSLLGMTYGLPAVTFETPGDALPVRRLGLPSPPGSRNSENPQERNNTGTFHFGITSDPIFMGTCRGLLASCTFAGYSFDSLCHTGKRCVYDVVKDLGWHSSILSHGIAGVISDVLERYETVPECVPVGDCVDCEGWKEVGGSTTMSSMSSTATETKTSTCSTPGWFGCRDKTTSATATPTS